MPFKSKAWSWKISPSPNISCNWVNQQLWHLVKVRGLSSWVTPQGSPFTDPCCLFLSCTILLPCPISKRLFLGLAYRITTDLLLHIYLFSNPIIPCLFNMAEPWRTLIKSFHLSPSSLHTFGTLSIHVMPYIPLRLSIYTTLILDISFSFHSIISVP